MYSKGRLWKIQEVKLRYKGVNYCYLYTLQCGCAGVGKVPECSGVRWKVLSKRILEGSNKYQKGTRVERLGIGVQRRK